MDRKEVGPATPRDSEMMRTDEASSAKTPAEKSSEKSSKKKTTAEGVRPAETANVSEKKDVDIPRPTRLADLIQVELPAEATAEKPVAEGSEEADEDSLQDLLEVFDDVPRDQSELSAFERKEVVQQLLEDEGELLEQEHELTGRDTPEEAEVLVAATFLQAANKRIQAGVEPEQALAEAQQEVLQGLDLSVELAEPLGADATELGDELDPMFLGAFEADDDEEDDDDTVTTTHAAQPPTPPPLQKPAGGPVPPSFPGQHRQQSVVPPLSQFEAAARQSTVERRRAKRRGADLLVGGIVGYLIGRRHGRINTEQQLLPIQQSLEKKVKGLQADVVERTQTIRKLTAEHISVRGESARRRIVEAVEKRVEKQSRPVAIAAERPEQRPVQVPVPEQQQERRVQVTEAPDILPVPAPVTAEAIKRPEASQPEQMPLHEVLQVAARIDIAGTTAKALYEQGRLEKKDLQIIAREYVRGSNRYERILVEKLRPPRTAESLERLTGQAGGQVGAAGGGMAPVLTPLGMVAPAQTSTQPVNMAAENRLAQARLEASAQKQSANNTLLVLAAVAGVIIAAVGIALF